MSNKVHVIYFNGLTKLTLNKWYASSHWSERSRIKKDYKWLVKRQFRDKFPKDRKYKVRYDFEFRVRPLDASNVIAMVKLIEDIIFEDDKWDIVTELTTSSKKGKEDRLKVTVEEID